MIRNLHFFLMVAMAACLSSDASAQSPAGIGSTDAMWGYRAPSTYQILPRPATRLGLHDDAHTHRPETPKLELKPTTPYAYGWFGTKYSPQFSRHFGYTHSYTQWTLK